MPRLIDADELKMCIRMLAKDIARAHGGVDDATLALKEVYDMVDDQHTIDAEPVRHGRWIHRQRYYEMDECDCSECGQRMTTGAGQRMAYCPSCGAKMDKYHLETIVIDKAIAKEYRLGKREDAQQ